MKQNLKEMNKLLLYFILLIFLSCCKKQNLNEEIYDDLSVNKSKILFHRFPDTVKINTVVDGFIQYDTNNISFDNRQIHKRYIRLILSTDNNEDLIDFDEIEKDYLIGYTDTLVTGFFNFKAVFEKKGTRKLNIALRDYIYLKPDENIPPDKLLLKISDCLFSKDVFVSD